MELFDCRFGIVDCGILLGILSDYNCFNPKSAIRNPLTPTLQYSNTPETYKLNTKLFRLADP
jgi:hypothetical protein